MKKLRKGFTIVELVIVIAVIAILTAILVPTFVHLSKKAKTASDQSLVANLNTALKMEQAETGKSPSTMHEAVEGLYRQGYVLENLVTKSGEDLVYNLDENKFYLTNDVDGSANKAAYWHIYSQSELPAAAQQTWSVYAKGLWAGESAEYTVKVGFDAGDTSGKYKVKFSNEAEVSAVVRTNSADQSLSVYAPNGTVKHYGDVGSLEIIAVKDGSYHEHGSAGFAEINKGRIVLENDSEIKHIHINKKDSSSFDTVVVEDKGAEALPQAITRDEISLASGSVDVVTVVSSGSEEVVKVYADGSTGSTQKTETQNAAVASELGQLVLDNGASEKKALDEGAKEEAKTEAVDELAGEEVAGDPDANKYVARIGTKGYVTFKGAVEAAKEGEIIRILASSIVIDSDIGEYTNNQYKGLNNVVLIDKDTTIYFQNNARVYMTNNGYFALNNNKLYVNFESSCDGSTDCGFMNCNISDMYSGLHEEYWDYKFEGDRARIMCDFQGTEDVAPGIGLVYNTTDGYRIVGGMTSGNNCAYDEQDANYQYINGVEQPGGGQWTEVVMIGDVARFYLGAEEATYSWKIYGDGNWTKDVETSKYVKIEENHNNWVVVKGLVNENGMNGSPAILEVTITYADSSTITYEWWLSVRGGNSGTPGFPPDFDIEL